LNLKTFMTKDSRLLRIGVLGCGPIAQIAHFDAIRKAHNAELYAICDIAADLREKMTALHQPRRQYPDYEVMLNDPQVEAVVIAVADQFHVPLARRALEAGKPVLVEKPLGVTVEESDELAQLAARSGLVLQVGHNRRFDPGVAFARDFVRDELGALLCLKAWYYDSTDRYVMTDNLQPLTYRSSEARKPAGEPKSDRRRYFLLTHGSHLLDTARFLAGPLHAVQTRWRENSGSHCWFIAVEFESGALGHLDLIVPIRGDFEEGFTVQGDGGSVKARVFLPWFHKSAEVECFSAKDGVFHRPLGADAHSYKRQIEGFAATILDDALQSGANAADGAASVRAMVAVARSSESGEWVKLADMTGSV
jgi:predicted dehydrogenase